MICCSDGVNREDLVLRQDLLFTQLNTLVDILAIILLDEGFHVSLITAIVVSTVVAH